jgi:hypothetical protein
MRAHMTVLGTGLLAVLSVLAASHPAAAVTIADLAAHPDSYNGQTVTVTGTVALSLPVNGESLFELRDGTAKVTVISRSGPPATGSRLAVTGSVFVFHEGDGDQEENNWPPVVKESSRAPAP